MYGDVNNIEVTGENVMQILCYDQDEPNIPQFSEINK
jgi:hypothetical protein